MERVCAVVVTYNRKMLLRQCLDALQRQTHPLAEIIVVDNASTDGTGTMLNAEFPAVEVIRLLENRGGAGGFHAGMKAAMEREADWIWVMDDDAEPAADALEQLFTPGLHRQNDTVALASMRVNPDGKMQRGSAGWYAPFRMSYDLVATTGDAWERIGYATFVGLMVRVQAVREIGLPEAGYFIRADDNEYVLRLSRIGDVFLIRDSKIIHHDASESKQTPTTLFARLRGDRPVRSYWRHYYALRNKLLIVRAHARTPLQRWRGYTTGFRHLLRSAVAVLVFDNHKLLRLKVLFQAFVHGVQGRQGKHIDPAHFPPDQDKQDK